MYKEKPLNKSEIKILKRTMLLNDLRSNSSEADKNDFIKAMERCMQNRYDIKIAFGIFLLVLALYLIDFAGLYK